MERPSTPGDAGPVSMDTTHRCAFEGKPGVAILLILLATVAVYWNSLSGVLIFDDLGSIYENASIRRLWPVWTVLTQSDYATTVSRPLLNVSLALNYAAGGFDVTGYHLVNVVIHALAGLALYGVLRRTFRLPSLKNTPVGRTPAALALVTALIWTIHPLQTESVTYICQRAESLAGLFYLLVFYCALRETTGWHVLAVVACLLGICTKETLATAPVMLLLFDRLFLAGTFQEALRRRWGLYAGLAATWVLLAVLMFNSGGRQDSAGFGLGMTGWEYARTQPYYIVRYLALSFWPGALTLDYGPYVAHSASEIVPYAMVLAVLLAGAVLLFRLNPQLGYLGAWVLVILMPTSSVVPLVTQTGAEHRMYLPLAGVAALVLIGVQAGFSKLQARPPRVCVIVGLTGIVLALGARTVIRNRDYQSSLAIWQDTVNKRPDNARAHNNLARSLLDVGRSEEAITHCQTALRLNPQYAEAHYNLGQALLRQDKLDDAVTQFREALRSDSVSPAIRIELGNGLTRQGNFAEAVAQFEIAGRVRAESDAETHYNWGVALLHLNRPADAIVHLRRAVDLQPNYAQAHNNLGVALVGRGEREEAARHFREALRLKPDYADARENLSNTLTAVRE